MLRVSSVELDPDALACTFRNRPNGRPMGIENDQSLRSVASSQERQLPIFGMQPIDAFMASEIRCSIRHCSFAVRRT